jgi:fucose 4-O-acetylase-like acetyltransferase
MSAVLAGPRRPSPLGTARTLAAATPAGRDRYVDLLRVGSMLVVVLGHWLMTVASWQDGHLTGGNALTSVPGLWLATWVLQVMPVFFFVGGFSNLVMVQAVARSGGGWAEFVTGRAARLLRPTVAFVAVWLALPPVLGLLGVPDAGIGTAARLVPQPLWFLGVYLIVVAVAPVMVGLHRRYGLRVPAALAFGAVVVDVARLGLGITVAGYLNVVLVWLFAHQLGFLYADGTLTRCSRRVPAAMAVLGLTAMAALTASGRYPASMVGLPGAETSNMNPPSACILALTLWQLGLVLLARDAGSRWLARPRVWTMVVAAGSVAMTMFLWHLTALVAVVGALGAARIRQPAPGSAAWWLLRPVWLAALAVALLPLVLAFARFERPAPLAAAAAAARSRHGRLATALGVFLVTLGILGFVVGGFHPLLGARGGMLVGIRVDAVQSVLHLALGWLLLRSARTGAVVTPAPWLLVGLVDAAVGLRGLLGPEAAPLVPLPVNGPGGVLHVAVAALGLLAAVATTRVDRRVDAPPAGACHAEPRSSRDPVT